jgi:hypothetical protein
MLIGCARACERLKRNECGVSYICVCTCRVGPGGGISLDVRTTPKTETETETKIQTVRPPGTQVLELYIYSQ